jgi:orotidine-5'-phosphate decarboxylase
MNARDRLVFPLDVPDLGQAERWIDRMAEHVGVFKIGLELFSAVGPAAIELVHRRDKPVFLDLKLHDIPATVAGAARAAAERGVRYLTVHAASGSRALEEARRAVEGSETRLLAITVLTSLEQRDLAAIGVDRPLAENVLARARLAIDRNIHGLVCSAHECRALRDALGAAPELVVPGIRPAGADAGDQGRVATPASAIREGATLLVVGRPIRDAADPRAAAAAIVAEIEAA